MPEQRVTSIEVPLETIIKRADPDFYRDRRKQIEYEFSNGRKKTADPSTRGAYNETPNVRVSVEP